MSLAGRLRQKITLREPVVSDDTKGSRQRYQDAATDVFAQVVPKLVVEQTLGSPGGDNIAAQYDLRVVIRYRENVDVGWHIVWRGDEYRIEGVIDGDGKTTATRQWLTLGCVRAE